MRLIALVFASVLLSVPAQAGVRDAKRAVLMDPANTATWIALGDAYERAGKNRKASNAYQQALALDPENEELTARLAEVNRLRVGRLERRALRHPEDDEIWGDLGDAHAAVGEKDRAIKYYMRAIQLDPSDGEWHGALTKVAGPEQAIEILSELTELGVASDEMYGDMGDVLFNNGGTEQACDYWNSAAELDPADSEWTNNLSMYCTEFGYDPFALGASDMLGYGEHGYIGGADGFPQPEHLSEYGEISPEDLGSLLGIVGAEGGGGAGLGLVADAAPDSDVLTSLARTKLLAGDEVGALDLFTRAFEVEPTSAEAQTGLMALSGKTRIALLEEARAWASDNDEFYGDLGDAYLAAGRLDDAAAAFAKAAEIDPGDSEWAMKLIVLSPTGASQSVDEE